MPPTLPASYTTVGLVQQVVTPKIGSASTLTSAHVSDFIGLAQAEINAVLAKQYPLPIAHDVPLLTNLSTTLAGYYILRRFFTQESPNDSDWVDKWREDAKNLLEKIMDHDLELVTSSGALIGRNASGSVEAWSTTMGYNPTFYETDMNNTFIDNQKLEDQDDDRS